MMEGILTSTNHLLRRKKMNSKTLTKVLYLTTEIILDMIEVIQFIDSQI